MLPDLPAEIIPTKPHHLLGQMFEISSLPEDWADAARSHQTETPGEREGKIGVSRVLPRCHRKETELSDFSGLEGEGEKKILSGSKPECI